MSDNKQQRDYMRYSSLGIQMVVIVLMFTGLGYWIDKKTGNGKPLWTALLAVAGVMISLVYVVKETMKGKNDK